MTNVQTIVALNRLLYVTYRSFPMYLSDAAPWVHANGGKAVEVLANVVADQKSLSQRVGEMILDLNGRLGGGSFPMEFTDTNDLSLEYLVKELIRYQRQDIAKIERIVPTLEHHPAAHALALEVLGSQRAHLDSLQDLVKAAA